MNQQTKMSGELATIKLNMDITNADRAEKHKILMDTLQEIKNSFVNHTTDEMHKFDVISQKFTNIEEKLSESSLENDKVKWKVYGMWGVLVSIVFLMIDKIKAMLGL